VADKEHAVAKQKVAGGLSTQGACSMVADLHMQPFQYIVMPA